MVWHTLNSFPSLLHVGKCHLHFLLTTNKIQLQSTTDVKWHGFFGSCGGCGRMQSSGPRQGEFSVECDQTATWISDFRLSESQVQCCALFSAWYQNIALSKYTKKSINVNLLASSICSCNMFDVLYELVWSSCWCPNFFYDVMFSSPGQGWQCFWRDGVFQKGQDYCWNLKGDLELRSLPFISEKKQMLNFMKLFQAAFSTNVSFTQQILNNILLILHKTKIALTFFWDVCSRIFSEKKTKPKKPKASGFGSWFLNVLEMISSESFSERKGMFQALLITIHRYFGKKSSEWPAVQKVTFPYFSCKFAQGAFHTTPAWIILLLTVMSEWANAEVVYKKCCQHGTAVFSL